MVVYAHLARMNDDRLPKQLLFGNMHRSTDAQCKQGRQIKGWIDYVSEDFSSLRLSYRWYRLAQGRANWRNSISKLLQHT